MGRSRLRLVAQNGKKKKSVSARVFVVLVSLFFVFYMSGSIIKFMQKETIPSARVVYGSIGTPDIIDGIIVRTERVYTSQRDGVLIFYAADGERVKNGGYVCSVRNQEELASIEQSLDNINKSILNEQRARDDYSIFSDDVRRENERIKHIIDEGMYKLLDLNMSDLYIMKDSVDKHLSLKNQMLLSEGRGSLVGLTQERAIYENMLVDNVSAIVAEASGLVSYSLDGFEEKLNPETMYSLNKMETTSSPTPTIVAGNVSADTPVFKIVESNEWYIVAYIPSNLIGKWNEGDYRTIYVKNNNTEAYTAQEVYIIEMTTLDKESFVIMRCTKGLLNYLSQRSIQFKITEGTNEGIKIPNTAIVDLSLFKIPIGYIISNENENSLLRPANEGVETFPVLVKGSDEENALVLQDFTGLRLGDTILHPETNESYIISEVENVKGVYVLNTGIAEFRRIVIDEDTPSNSSHTILNQTSNSSLRAYDIIVSDAKNVSEGQTIF